LGGTDPALQLVRKAIEQGSNVVTGNKALLATYGDELYEAAAAAGLQLSFEASVAGAIPILRPLRDSLSGDKVTRIMGIVNGTTNYILDQMDSTGASFHDALAEAQRLGYAEADPTADVGGADAAAKIAVLAHLAFHTTFSRDLNLVAVHGAYKAEFVEPQTTGDVMFYGRGACGTPTGSAVMDDVMSIATRKRRVVPGRTHTARRNLQSLDIGAATTR